MIVKTEDGNDRTVMMESYEAFLKEATTPGPNRTLPGVAVIAVDGNGSTPLSNSGFTTNIIHQESPTLTPPAPNPSTQSLL